MAHSIETLRRLTRQAEKGDPAARGELQEKVHLGLVLVIRRVLRTGKGVPALTRWIGRALESLPRTEGSDPSDALARMLCNGLARPELGPERGTILAAETIVEMDI